MPRVHEHDEHGREHDPELDELARMSKKDSELAGLVGDAKERQAATGVDGMSFIDWHSAAGDLIARRHTRALANAFNKSRQDTGTLGERFAHGIKTMQHTLAHGELPPPPKPPAPPREPKG